MLRIKTQLDGNRIYTLTFNGKWVTMAALNGRRYIMDANTLLEAGQNHLFYCRKLIEVSALNDLG